jgi:DNA-binding NarL/FixJ family response regulator
MINLMVADDHVVLREALCELLKNRGGFNVMAQAGDGQQLLDVVKNTDAKPDVIILDVEMPNLSGIETLHKLQEMGVQVPVLVLSADDGAKNVRTVLSNGAKGFMPKNARIEELEFAIDAILQGNTYLSPTITTFLINGDKNDPQANISVLTKREVEILKYLADGKPNREIGKILHISSRTVDTHRSNILKKLKLKTNAELVKVAITAGLIDV